MPVISERSINDNLREIRFDKTPIMSTYLVAAVIGEYDYVEANSKDGVLVRVYTPVGKKDQGINTQWVQCKFTRQDTMFVFKMENYLG